VPLDGVGDGVGVAPEALGEGDEDEEEEEGDEDDEEGDEDDEEGDGDGDFDGDGEGDGVLAGGSSWQVVSVFGDELGLGVAETARSEAARAMVGQTASTPKLSKPAASKLSIVARTCAKRI
jgi:hypothetical protein